MLTFEQIRDETLAELDQLSCEAQIVYRELVLPGWASRDRHGFPSTLYGFVMNSFGYIDLLSRYQGAANGQTARMRRFMADYLKADDEAARFAVQLWRHTLMHTGQPRALQDEVSGKEVLFLLHWGEHLPRERHMTVIPGGQNDQLILNTGTLYLIEDLRAGATQFFTDTASTGRQQVESAYAAMATTQVAKV